MQLRHGSPRGAASPVSPPSSVAVEGTLKGSDPVATGSGAGRCSVRGGCGPRDRQRRHRAVHRGNGGDGRQHHNPQALLCGGGDQRPARQGSCSGRWSSDRRNSSCRSSGRRSSGLKRSNCRSSGLGKVAARFSGPWSSGPWSSGRWSSGLWSSSLWSSGRGSRCRGSSCRGSSCRWSS